MRGLWHCGQALTVGALALCCDRRLVGREGDCFGLGTAIGRWRLSRVVELELGELGPPAVRLTLVCVLWPGCIEVGTAHRAQAGAVLTAVDRGGKRAGENV